MSNVIIGYLYNKILVNIIQNYNSKIFDQLPLIFIKNLRQSFDPNHNMQMKIRQKITKKNQPKQSNKTNKYIHNYANKFQQLIRICQSISKKPLTLTNNNNNNNIKDRHQQYKARSLQKTRDKQNREFKNEQEQENQQFQLQITDQTIETVMQRGRYGNRERLVKSSRSFRLDLPQIKQRQCQQDQYFITQNISKNNNLKDKSIHKLCLTQRINKSASCLHSIPGDKDTVYKSNSLKKNTKSTTNQMLAKTRSQTKSSVRSKSNLTDSYNSYTNAYMNINVNKQVKPFNYHDNVDGKSNRNIQSIVKQSVYNSKNKSKDKGKDKDRMTDLNMDDSTIGTKIKQKVKLNVDVRKLLQIKTYTYTNSNTRANTNTNTATYTGNIMHKQPQFKSNKIVNRKIISSLNTYNRSNNYT